MMIVVSYSIFPVFLYFPVICRSTRSRILLELIFCIKISETSHSRYIEYVSLLHHIPWSLFLAVKSIFSWHLLAFPQPNCILSILPVTVFMELNNLPNFNSFYRLIGWSLCFLLFSHFARVLLSANFWA